MQSDPESCVLEPLVAQSCQPLPPPRRTVTTRVTFHTTTIISALIPSFLLRQPPPSRTTASQTSYLTSLRGLGALLVFIQHATENMIGREGNGYTGLPGEDDRLLQLPLLRAPTTSGQFAVAVFYVLSGLVLSLGPLGHAHAGRPERTLAGVPSSLVRRPIRLVLPAAATAAASVFLVWWGLVYRWDLDEGVEMDAGWWIASQKIAPAPTFAAQVWSELVGLWRVFDPFTWEQHLPAAHPQFWTLSAELRCSLALFAFVAALVRCRWETRVVLTALVAFAATFLASRWEMGLFLAGMIFTDLRLARQSPSSEWLPLPVSVQGNSIAAVGQLPTSDGSDLQDLGGSHSGAASTRTSSDDTLIASNSAPFTPSDSGGGFYHNRKPRESSRARYIPRSEFVSIVTCAFWWSLLVVAILLGGCPHGNMDAALLYRSLYPWTPLPYGGDPSEASTFWTGLAAVLLLTATEHLPRVQEWLNARALLYLGDVSYALYLVHWTVLYTLGYAVFNALLLRQGAETAVSELGWWWTTKWGAWIVTMVPTTVVTFWAADVHWRLVDVKSVTLAKTAVEWLAV